MATAGDKNQSQALYLLGGKSLWTKELESALEENVVDMLVHSLKDCPTVLPDGCEIGAVLEREDPVDSLVVKDGKGWRSLEELPEGSVVGTSSVRRVAQLRRLFPGLIFLDVVSSCENLRYCGCLLISMDSAEICKFYSPTSVLSDSYLIQIAGTQD
jgi:hydroxymethylbilane synthase